VREEAARRIDRFRYHLWLGALGGGLALSPAGAATAALATVAVAVPLVAARRAAAGAACAVCLLAGAVAGELRLRAIDGPGERLAAWSRVDERAVLLEAPRAAGTRMHATVRLAGGAKVLAVADDPGVWDRAREPGLELRVRGLLKPPLRSEGDDFDWPAHLRRRGIAYELQLSALEPTGGRRGGLAGAVDSARRRAERAVSAGLAPDRAALVRGMVLGEDEDVDALTKDDWRDSGLAHLLAVSGQNVMLLCALALPFLALTGAPPRARIAALLALIALYVPLAGAGPSLQRAAAMGAAGLVALASSRPASASYGLLVAAAATLAVNPRVSGDAGWQLSFAAVVGILAARPFAPRGPVAGAAWLSAAATVATTPLLALHFQAVPLVSIPANLAALPAVAPVMWIGMVQAALGQLAGLGGPAAAAGGAAARGLSVLSEPLLAWLQTVARRFATAPHAVAAVRSPGPAPVAAAYALLALLAGACAAASRLRSGLAALRERARLVPLQGRLAAGLLAAALAVVAGSPLLGRGSPPSELTVSFLDVGQGDATLIQHPDGSAVLFDGGRPEARVARLLDRAGVRRLAIVVATHASADHHGGLAEVIRRFPVDVLVDGGDGTRDPTYRALIADARARGIRVIPVRAGERLQAGAISIRILWPLPRPPGPPPEDPNPRGTIAIVSSGGFDLMLSADAESPSLEQVHLPDVEAIKVPHHGSADPGLAGILSVLRPEVAVIEVGRGNTYGHPRPETLRTLEAMVPQVRRTDRDGTVRLRVEGGRMRLD
jgi:competence protein ComEC